MTLPLVWVVHRGRGAAGEWLGAAPEDGHAALAFVAAYILTVGAHDQVRVSVRVQVSAGDRDTEVVTLFRCARHPCGTLGEFDLLVVRPVADPRATTTPPAADAPFTDLYGAPIAISRCPSPLKSSAYLAGAADAGVAVTAVNRPPVSAVTVAAATAVRNGRGMAVFSLGQCRTVP